MLKFSRRNFFRCLILLGLVLFAPILVIYRKIVFSEKSKEFGIQKAKLTEIPFPEAVSGPYGIRVCLSPDGKCLAVAGNIHGPSTYFDPKDYAQEVIPAKAGFAKLFEKKIFVSKYPPTLGEYRLVSNNRKLRTILAMSISSSESKQIAFLSRESHLELPNNISQMNPQDIQDLFNEIEKQQLQDVLYVVSADGNSDPQKLGVLETNIPMSNLNKDLSVMSLTWLDDSSSVICYNGKSMIKMSLSGEKKQLFTKEQHHHIPCFITSKSNRHITFLDCYFVPNPDTQDGNPKAVKQPELITIDENGTIVERKTLPFFPLFGEEWYNFAILGSDHWAYLFPEEDGYTLHVCSYENSYRKKIFHLDVSPQNAEYFKLCSFFPTDNEIVLIQKIDLTNQIYNVFNMPRDPFVRIKVIKL
jgi:hypothetical protein